MIVAQIHLWSEPFAARVYAGALLAAALTVPLLAAALAAKRGLPLARVAACLMVAAMATPVGDRLLHGWTHPGVQGPNLAQLLSLDLRDFSLYGGLLLGGLAGALCCRLCNVRCWVLADCVAPALGVGIVIVRCGCFANGCCFGVETDRPWGVVYPSGSPAHLHQIAANAMAIFGGCRPVHPTQLYEMLAAGAAALLALVLLERVPASRTTALRGRRPCAPDGLGGPSYRRNRLAARFWGTLLRRNLPSGVPFLAAAIVFTGFRWISEPLRVHSPTLVTAGWSYRLLYAALIAVGSAALLWRLREKMRRDNGLVGSLTVADLKLPTVKT